MGPCPLALDKVVQLEKEEEDRKRKKIVNQLLWFPKPSPSDNFFKNKHFKKCPYTNYYTFRKIRSNTI